MVVFFVAGLAEIRRPPFDMPIADSELVFGYMTEYTGLRFAFFLLAEYVGIVVIAALTTVLFLGGWKGPFAEQLGWLWTLVKVGRGVVRGHLAAGGVPAAARGPAAAAVLAGPGAGGAGPAGADRRRSRSPRREQRTAGYRAHRAAYRAVRAGARGWPSRSRR